MFRSDIFGALAALALALSVPVAQAYEATLAPAALHDAYVLGQRNDQTTAEFLDPYANQTTGAATTRALVIQNATEPSLSRRASASPTATQASIAITQPSYRVNTAAISANAIR